jgi:streptogramin lyase
MTVLFAAAAVAGLAYWLTRGAARTVVVARNSLAAIDPKTDRLVADVRVGDGPGKVVAAGDHVWTLNAASRTVSEIDVTQRDAPRTFAIGGSPGDLAVGDGALWTTETTTHRLEKIDPTSGATIGSVPAIGRVRSGRTGTPYPSTRDGGEVAVGSSGVWFGSDHATVTRVDPRTLHPETTVRNLNVGPGGQLVVVPGAVWVDDSFGNVTQIDPLTTDVVGEAHLATGDVGGIAVDAKAVWATATDEGLVWEIAPQTDAPVDSFRVAPDPVGVALGASSVWVASAGGTVTRLDPATGGTTTIAVGGSPQGVAFADGLVWVSVD